MIEVRQSRRALVGHFDCLLHQCVQRLISITRFLLSAFSPTLFKENSRVIRLHVRANKKEIFFPTKVSPSKRVETINSSKRKGLTMIKFCIFGALLMAVSANKGSESLHKKPSNPFFLHGECLGVLQSQINEELHASLVYLNMAAHFSTLNVARKGFGKFFDESSKEEREHAKKIIDYVTQRGGAVDTMQVKMPTASSWSGALGALESALALEERVNKHLHQVHDTANHVCDDPHLMDFIENEFLTEQVESISELRRYITVLSAMDTGMGEYLMDRQLDGHKTEL